MTKPTYWHFILSLGQHTGSSYCHLDNILAVHTVTWTTYWQFILSLGPTYWQFVLSLGQHTGSSYCHLTNILGGHIVTWPTMKWQRLWLCVNWLCVVRYTQPLFHTHLFYAFCFFISLTSLVNLHYLLVCAYFRINALWVAGYITITPNFW